MARTGLSTGRDSAGFGGKPSLGGGRETSGINVVYSIKLLNCHNIVSDEKSFGAEKFAVVPCLF
jgi:hypothetical protein